MSRSDYLNEEGEIESSVYNRGGIPYEDEKYTQLRM